MERNAVNMFDSSQKYRGVSLMLYKHLQSQEKI